VGPKADLDYRESENSLSYHDSNSCHTVLQPEAKYSSQSQSYITTDSQSASLSWFQAPIWDPRQIFLLLHLIIFFLVFFFTDLLPWEILSDEKSDLNFSVVAGYCQRNLSQF
jgi:hypothetical protein